MSDETLPAAHRRQAELPRAGGSATVAPEPETPTVEVVRVVRGQTAKDEGEE